MKLLKTGTIACVAVGLALAVAHADTLIDENFESGKADTGKEMTLSKPGSTHVKVSPENPKDGKFSLRFEDHDSQEKRSWEPSASFRFTEQFPEAKLRVSFDCYLDSGENPMFTVELGSSHGNGKWRLLRLILNSPNLFVPTTGKSLGSPVDTSLAPGAWHRIVIDCSASRQAGGFSVTVDGVERGSVPYWAVEPDEEGFPVDRLSIMDDGNGDDVVYIDNVKVESFSSIH